MTDRPNARRHGWAFIRTAQPYRHRIFNVREDWLRWPDGVERSYAYMEVGPAVLIVPVTPAGDVVLIREFRYLVDDWGGASPPAGRTTTAATTWRRWRNRSCARKLAARQSASST